MHFLTSDFLATLKLGRYSRFPLEVCAQQAVSVTCPVPWALLQHLARQSIWWFYSLAVVPQCNSTMHYSTPQNTINIVVQYKNAASYFFSGNDMLANQSFWMILNTQKLSFQFDVLICCKFFSFLYHLLLVVHTIFTCRQGALLKNKNAFSLQVNTAIIRMVGYLQCHMFNAVIIRLQQ